MTTPESKLVESLAADDAKQFIQGMAQFAQLMGELTENMIKLDMRQKAYEKEVNERVERFIDIISGVSSDVNLLGDKLDSLQRRVEELEQLMQPPRMTRSTAAVIDTTSFIRFTPKVPKEDRLTGTPSPEVVESWCADRGSH